MAEIKGPIVGRRPRRNVKQELLFSERRQMIVPLKESTTCMILTLLLLSESSRNCTHLVVITSIVCRH